MFPPFPDIIYRLLHRNACRRVWIFHLRSYARCGSVFYSWGTLWALDRHYQLLGKVEQERIGLYFPFLEYTTANAIYFSADGGTITHYIDPHHLDCLELIQLVDPTARSHG